MRQSRFTEEQIIAILAEQEHGMKTSEVCRKHEISQNTFYKWEVSTAARSCTGLPTERVYPRAGGGTALRERTGQPQVGAHLSAAGVGSDAVREKEEKIRNSIVLHENRYGAQRMRQGRRMSM